VPSLPIPQSVVECYQQASRARSVYLLNAYGAQAAQSASPGTSPLLSEPVAPGPRKPEWEAAMSAWYACLYDATDALAGQPEPAQTVADAAFGSCTKAEARFREAANLDFDALEKLKADTTRKQVVARVMAMRAAAAKLRENPPSSDKPARPAIEYNKM